MLLVFIFQMMLLTLPKTQISCSLRRARAGLRQYLPPSRTLHKDELMRLYAVIIVFLVAANHACFDHASSPILVSLNIHTFLQLLFLIRALLRSGG